MCTFYEFPGSVPVIPHTGWNHGIGPDPRHDIPQGSVLGPLEFISYTDAVSEIFSRQAVNYHLFADDKQLSESDKVSHLSSIGMRY